MVARGWRTAAIIFIIISILLMALFAWGYSMANTKDKCSAYCYGKEYESFYYDYNTKTCECYVGENMAENITL